MKQKELEEAREEYKRLIEERKVLIGYKNELLELLKDEKVKKYLQLSKLVDLEYKGPSDFEIIKRAFHNGAMLDATLNSNYIMVYQGTYIQDKVTHDQQLTYDFDPEGHYKVYRDLETTETYNVSINDSDEYERKNLTIYVPVQDYNSHEYFKKYLEIKCWFLEQLITKSQSDVIAELSKKYVTKHETMHEPNRQLVMNGDNCIGSIDTSFDPEKFDTQYAQGGFVEKMCLSQEEQKRLRLYRKQKEQNDNGKH